MKKIIALIFAAVLPVLASGQDNSESALPFSRLVKMKPTELVQARFNYDVNKNRYQIKKGDFWGAMEERPKRKNYKIVVQYGKKGAAYAKVEFTNPVAYHEIMEYVLNNNIDHLETVSNRMVKTVFEYEGLKCTLTRVPKYKETTYTSETGTYSRTKDISHENFTMLIDTGVKPSSRWHDQQKEKQERRAKRNGRPHSVMDFM